MAISRKVVVFRPRSSLHLLRGRFDYGPPGRKRKCGSDRTERREGGFRAAVKKAGRVLACEGPFATPEAAHLAMAALLAREFPAAAGAPAVPRVRLTLADYLAAA